MVTCPNASFTDLAEIVSRIEPVKSTAIEGTLLFYAIYLLGLYIYTLMYFYGLRVLMRKT